MLCLVLYLDRFIISPVLQPSKPRLLEVTSLSESAAELATHPALSDSSPCTYLKLNQAYLHKA